MDVEEGHLEEATQSSQLDRIVGLSVSNGAAFRAGLFATLGVACAVPVLILGAVATVGFLVAVGIRLVVPVG